MKATTPEGAIPAKVSENARAIVTAGLANDVDAVNTASVLETRGLILRIIVVAFLAALFWHTVIAAGTP
jgi:hypothetical protein